MIIGDNFLCWLSTQPERTASVHRSLQAIETLTGRCHEYESPSRILLHNLHRAGHVEYANRSRRHLRASSPTLVANDICAAKTIRAEWIGARGRSTIRRAAAAFSLSVESELTHQEYTRTFLLGYEADLNECIKTVAGSLQMDPTSRLLNSLPAISRQSLVDAEKVPVPYEGRVHEFRPVKAQESSHWRKVESLTQARNGLFRVDGKPFQYLWHESGTWSRLDGENRHVAAWCDASTHGLSKGVFQVASGHLSIAAIGFSLPVLCDRALRLRAGPPVLSDKSIQYFDVRGSDAEEISRILGLRLLAQ